MDYNTLAAQLNFVQTECYRYLDIVRNDPTATQILSAVGNLRERVRQNTIRFQSPQEYQANQNAHGVEVGNLYQHIINLFEQSRVQFEKQQQQQQQQQHQQHQQQHQQQQQQQL